MYIYFPFLSSRFENPFSIMVFNDGIQLKTRNMPFKSFTNDLTVLQYWHYYFYAPHKVDGEGFLSQISTVPSDKKSNCGTCAVGCRMLFKY